MSSTQKKPTHVERSGPPLIEIASISSSLPLAVR